MNSFDKRVLSERGNEQQQQNAWRFNKLNYISTNYTIQEDCEPNCHSLVPFFWCILNIFWSDASLSFTLKCFVYTPTDTRRKKRLSEERDWVFQVIKKTIQGEFRIAISLFMQRPWPCTTFISTLALCEYQYLLPLYSGRHSVSYHKSDPIAFHLYVL